MVVYAPVANVTHLSDPEHGLFGFMLYRGQSRNCVRAAAGAAAGDGGGRRTCAAQHTTTSSSNNVPDYRDATRMPQCIQAVPGTGRLCDECMRTAHIPDHKFACTGAEMRCVDANIEHLNV